MIVLISIAAWFACAQIDAPPPPADAAYRAIIKGTRSPPLPWALRKSTTVSGAEAAKFSGKLDGDVVEVTNAVFALDSESLQVNLVDCRTPQDAERVQRAVLAVHAGERVRALRDGSAVIEFTRGRIGAVIRAHYDLGFKPRAATYRITFEAAPMSRCEYMTWNKLYNSFLALEQPASKDDAEMRIASESRAFTFGGPIRLRTCGLGDERSRFTFTPAAQREQSEADGEILASSFEALPAKAGVPSVALTAVMTCTAFALTPSTRKHDPVLLAATEFWPTKDEEIAALAKEIVGDRATAREKTEAILAWLAPGANLRYAGDVLGSRHGVKQVLTQRFGRCWDFSDCCVTLCRAAGVPARQVAGWLYQQGGHVWAEVLLEGEGWWQIDPTAGTPCWTEHIPYGVSEDGQWSFVYTSAVGIEQVEPSTKH